MTNDEKINDCELITLQFKRYINKNNYNKLIYSECTLKSQVLYKKSYTNRYLQVTSGLQ